MTFLFYDFFIIMTFSSVAWFFQKVSEFVYRGMFYLLCGRLLTEVRMQTKCSEVCTHNKVMILPYRPTKLG